MYPQADLRHVAHHYYPKWELLGVDGSQCPLNERSDVGLTTVCFICVNFLPIIPGSPPSLLPRDHEKHLSL